LKQASPTFLKLPAVIGQDYFTATRLRACLELTTTWSIYSVNGDIINVVAQVAFVAPQSFVLRGSVQLVAAVATQLQSFSAEALATVSVQAWQQVRSQLKVHQHKRVKQRRFRRSPVAYLAQLETQLFQLTLPV
jgi:hypothetical protein